MLAFQGELLAFWFARYLTRGAEFVPPTFHIAWEIAAFVVCSLGLSAVARRLWGGKRLSFGMSIFATVQLAGLAACAVGVVGSVVPADWRWPAPAYSGVVARAPNDGGIVHIGDGVERPSRGFSTATFLYRQGSPELQAALADARNPGEHANVAHFVFWRTGLAAGFLPTGFEPEVQTFGPLVHLTDQMILFLTVGPAVLLECLLRAMFFSGPVLLFLVASWKMVKGWPSKRT